MPFSPEGKTDFARVALRIALTRVRETGAIDETVEGFWNPYFTAIAGRAPIMGKRTAADDAIWNEIIPAGYTVLKCMKTVKRGHPIRFYDSA